MKPLLPAPTPGQEAPRAVIIWLWCVFACIGLMVVIGGITRLTGSGLSMVEWKPLMGVLPPLSEAEWVKVFHKYQQFPQYQQVNAWMTLESFKNIYFWEYLHRLWGRLIGVVFLLPWLYFLVRRRLSRPLAGKTLIAFLLGGAQGLLGWFMVQSGLVDIPEVSHYRLAAHLALAFLVAGYIAWIAFGLTEREELLPPREPQRPRPSRRMVWTYLVVLAVQIVWGAFMAGKRAGHVSATFPDMNGELIPSAVGTMGSTDPFENPWTIHFIHRTFAWLLLLGGALLWWHVERRARTRRQRFAGRLVGAGTAVQFLLGVLTVVLYVPIWAAVMHQAGAFLLLTAGLLLAHSLRGPRAEEAGETAPAGAAVEAVTEAGRSAPS